MSDDKIRIERHELFDRGVDEALAKERAGRQRVIGDAPGSRNVSPIRALFMNPLFYLPTAAILGALAVWSLLEPKIEDLPIVSGEVVLINTDAFDANRGVIVMTIDCSNEERPQCSEAVYINPKYVSTHVGANGEPAFAGMDDIVVGSKIEVSGLEDESGRILARAVRPTTKSSMTGNKVWALFLLFPLTGAFVALGLLVAEGLTTRNWLRMVERSLLGSFMAALFCTLAFIPAGIFIVMAQLAMGEPQPDQVMLMSDVSVKSFVLATAFRGCAWACVGSCLGLGMNLVRSAKGQLRNSVIGGALGGAFGGLFFDPVDRFFPNFFEGAATSRLVGLLMVAVSIGFFLALVERLGRDAWLRVRTGPLAGKSFVLYKTPTTLGSAPACDVYLFKDAEIDATHASIHRVGMTYEIEDMGSRMGTKIGNNAVRRRRLVSGDQITIGSTILEFEERQKRTPAA